MGIHPATVDRTDQAPELCCEGRSWCFLNCREERVKQLGMINASHRSDALLLLFVRSI
ncbi:UNVERIFIED_CONTAM: hypothetical protein FKN15_058431 [Acipenser sinensis]